MKRLLPVVLFASVLSAPASAIDFRTVETPAVLYDTPSQRGAKLFRLFAR